MKFNLFFFICTTITITPSHKKTPEKLNANTLYEERMKIVALERRWINEGYQDSTGTNIRRAYDRYEQLVADLIIAQSQEEPLERKNSSPLSISSFFKAIINSPLFQNQK